MLTIAMLPQSADVGAMLLLGCTGIGYASLYSSPFEIAELIIRDNGLEMQRGRLTGLVATSLPLAQLVVGLLAGAAVQRLCGGRVELLFAGTGLVSLVVLVLLGASSSLFAGSRAGVRVHSEQ